MAGPSIEPASLQRFSSRFRLGTPPLWLMKLIRGSPRGRFYDSSERRGKSIARALSGALKVPGQMLLNDVTEMQILWPIIITVTFADIP